MPSMCLFISGILNLYPKLFRKCLGCFLQTLFLPNSEILGLIKHNGNLVHGLIRIYGPQKSFIRWGGAAHLQVIAISSMSCICHCDRWNLMILVQNLCPSSVSSHINSGQGQSVWLTEYYRSGGLLHDVKDTQNK